MLYKLIRANANVRHLNNVILYKTVKEKHSCSPYLLIVKNRHFREILTRLVWVSLAGNQSKLVRKMTAQKGPRQCCPRYKSVLEGGQQFILEYLMYNDLREKVASLFEVLPETQNRKVRNMKYEI